MPVDDSPSSWLQVVLLPLICPSRTGPSIQCHSNRCPQTSALVMPSPQSSWWTILISGLSFGFHLAFNPEPASSKQASQNMPTAFLQPSVIDQYLLTELEKGHLPGPFSKYPLANLHISGFTIIAKKYQPGKWPLIFDLSSPQGYSVNDGIPKDPFLAQYMKADNIIDGIMTHGRGSELFYT